MSIEDLRARQRKTVMRAQQSQLGLDYLREIEMKPESVQKLQSLHDKYWHSSVAALPDGWTAIVAEFLGRIDEIGDLADAVSLRFERCPDGARAFAFPEMSRWHPEQMNGLRIAQRNLLHASRETCEWCGKSQAEPVQLGDHVSFFLCSEHRASAEEKLAAQIEAFDERVRFRNEMSVLFQPMSCMSIQVGDHNFDIMRKALRDINKIVEERDLIGKVFITKIMESEGQLFISARCGTADPASQFEIQDIIKHAEWQSDQVSLAANKEGRDDEA